MRWGSDLDPGEDHHDGDLDKSMISIMVKAKIMMTMPTTMIEIFSNIREQLKIMTGHNLLLLSLHLLWITSWELGVGAICNIHTYLPS